MKWTREKPTWPGWYWYRASAKDAEAEVVRVDGEMVTMPGSSSEWFVEDLDGEWAGPIPEPK